MLYIQPWLGKWRGGSLPRITAESRVQLCVTVSAPQISGEAWTAFDFLKAHFLICKGGQKLSGRIKNIELRQTEVSV